MTHEEIVKLYNKSAKESYRAVPISNVRFKESKTPIRGAVLAILNNKLFWMASDANDDSIFPAYGPLESFDHAHAVITMRGYALDG